jgi:enoyl-CoA hydratase/carnithine racemase
MMLRLHTKARSTFKKESILTFAYQNGCRQIVLNRKKSYNALNLEMFEIIANLLRQWQHDPSVTCVVVTGAGKAFCSGGDLKQFISADEGHDRFTRLEYAVDLYIHHYSKAFLTIMNGITMGGGAGLACNGKYRIATEKLIFAMPEAAVGFVADVGSSHFLNQCPGQIGLYLALTGSQINAADAIFANLATHYVPTKKLSEFMEALFNYDLSNPQRIEELLSSFNEYPGKSTLAEHRDLIDRCFTANSVEEIINNLSHEVHHPFAKAALEKIQKNCPMSLKVTFELMRRSKGKSLKEALSLEFRVGFRMVRRDDIKEGVKAVLIKKDYSPIWNPPHVQNISDEDVARFFEPLPPSSEISFDLFAPDTSLQSKL